MAGRAERGEQPQRRVGGWGARRRPAE